MRLQALEEDVRGGLGTLFQSALSAPQSILVGDFMSRDVTLTFPICVETHIGNLISGMCPTPQLDALCLAQQ